MEMRLARQARALAGQCRAAFGAEAARRPAGCRFELGDLALGDPISRAFEIDKDGNRSAAVLATALAMAPIDALGLAGSNKTNRAAEAPTFELLNRVAHVSLPPGIRAEKRSAFRRKRATPPAQRCNAGSCLRPPSTDAPCRRCPRRGSLRRHR